MQQLRQLANPIDKLLSLVRIEQSSPVPKYRQLSYGIYDSIMLGRLQKGEPLPSINEISALFDVSRDTAEKGYRSLRQMGVIEAIPGKGFYISNCAGSGALKICLLFNKLSAHKKIIYDSFVQSVGAHGTVDLFIYNNDIDTFRSLVNTKRSDYSHYVVLPHFDHGEHLVPEILEELPKEKIYFLDRVIPDMKPTQASVYQDFERDLYDALEGSRSLLKKYARLNILFPNEGCFPKEILNGFIAFCNQNKFSFNMINKMEQAQLERGDVYISLVEEDLALLVEKIMDSGLQPGKDIGVISYNDTPLKRVVLNGITTVSTDFAKLGSESAKMILENRTEHIRVPFHLNRRNSL